MELPHAHAFLAARSQSVCARLQLLRAPPYRSIGTSFAARDLISLPVGLARTPGKLYLEPVANASLEARSSIVAVPESINADLSIAVDHYISADCGFHTCC